MFKEKPYYLKSRTFWRRTANNFRRPDNAHSEHIFDLFKFYRKEFKNDNIMKAGMA